MCTLSLDLHLPWPRTYCPCHIFVFDFGVGAIGECMEGFDLNGEISRGSGISVRRMDTTLWRSGEVARATTTLNGRRNDEVMK